LRLRVLDVTEQRDSRWLAGVDPAARHIHLHDDCREIARCRSIDGLDGRRPVPDGRRLEAIAMQQRRPSSATTDRRRRSEPSR